MSGNSSLEKYTSHFIERVVCERWVGDWTKTATYWPSSSSGHSSASFSFSWAVQPGAWGPSLSAESWFPQLDLEHWLQALNSNCLTSCLTPGYIIVLRSLNSTRRQLRPPLDLFDRMHLLFTQVHFFLMTAWPGRGSICNSIINLSLWVLRLKLVFYWSTSFRALLFGDRSRNRTRSRSLLLVLFLLLFPSEGHGVFYNSAIPKVKATIQHY